jgi:sulfate adenylyltransferase subunit 1
MTIASTLRFTTAGSVDDGKSTLIGRLLLDTKGLLEDQVASVAKATARRGSEGLDLSLFTDGLTLEREQGITIDVAYRYFATAKRRFIIADTPGHEQYTRNMVTGATTADLSVILVDAAKGISPQTRRHVAIAGLLAIPHVVFAVNKMDAVGWCREVFERTAVNFVGVAQSLGLAKVSVIPLSALEGDMVVERGDHMPWYLGPTLLELLEQTAVGTGASALRFPVQYVSSSRFGPMQESRGLSGRVESGTIAIGDRVVAWPGGVESGVMDIVTHDGRLSRAGAGRSITVVLDHQVDVARGDLLSHPHNPPVVARRVEARLAWLATEPLVARRRYLLKHGANTVRAQIESLESRLDLSTLEAVSGVSALELNDLGVARIAISPSIMVDRYVENRATGSFILMDEATNRTVAGGIVSRT